MKITHQLPKDNKVSLADMKPWDVGIDEDGTYYIRAYEGVLHLNDHSYIAPLTTHITLLPPGTVITLEL